MNLFSLSFHKAGPYMSTLLSVKYVYICVSSSVEHLAYTADCIRLEHPLFFTLF